MAEGFLGGLPGEEDEKPDLGTAETLAGADAINRSVDRLAAPLSEFLLSIYWCHSATIDADGSRLALGLAQSTPILKVKMMTNKGNASPIRV